MMKTMGRCHLTRSQAKSQAQARRDVKHDQDPPERDITHVYGLDSLVDKSGPRMQRQVIQDVYGLDTQGFAFRGDHQGIHKIQQKKVRKFFTRKAAPTRAMDDKGRVFYTSFTNYFPQIREKALLEAWPTLESSLKSFGISCSRNVDLVKLRSITFSTTLSTRGGPGMIDRAMDLLEILTNGDAPPLLAIQILDGSLQYDIIRIGRSYGFCSQLPLNKRDKHLDLVEFFRCSFLKELENLSLCDIFLTGATVVALGNSKRLNLVRYVVRACYFSSVKPATMIRVVNYFHQNGGENVEMNILGFEPANASLCGPSLNQDGKLVCGAFFSERRGKVLGKVWPVVQTTLKKYGISCRIYPDERFMIISTNKGQNIIHKARDILELLASTVAVPSRALLVLTDVMKHDIIKIGYQNGGLGKKVNMKRKQFAEQSDLIWAYRRDLEKVIRCDIYMNNNTVAAIAPDPERLSLVRNLVTRCIVGMEDPARMIEEIELEPEKKKQKVCHQQVL